MASIQTRTIGVVIFGQCLLVLPALNSLCFTAFTITVTLMPSFKQPLQRFSWDFGGISQCLACTPSTLSIVSLHSSNPFLWDFGFGQRLLPCLRSIHFVSLHSPSHYLRSNAKKTKLFSCTQATHFSWDCAISFLC